MSRKVHERFVDTAEGISLRLAQAIEEHGPVQLRKRQSRPLVETLCRAVAGQQLSTKASETIWSRVVESSEGQPLLVHVAKCEIDSLRACGLSNSKAKAMKAIVTAQQEGLLDEVSLAKMPYDARSKQLTSIWGVGPWTADMISIFFFGDEDVWPASDLTVWKTLERLTSRRRKTEMTALRFAPHRTYLALYMYKIADSSTAARAESS